MLVDDERPASELLKLLINWEQAGFIITVEASDGDEALEKYQIYSPDLIITDVQMPVLDGIELMRAVRKENPNQLFVVLSCHELFDYAQEALRLGAIDYLIKDSITPQQLINMLKKVESLLPAQSMSQPFSGIASYSSRIRSVAEYLLKNFDQDISLSSLAKVFNIHKVHLARTFKEETGINIHESILDLRMQKAKLLLADPAKKISDIIEEIGFHNPQYFYILFKKFYDISPSEYRAQLEKAQIKH